jgi:isoleucyl-tRNA synthetase
MKARLDYVLKQCKIAKHTILETVNGSELCGIEYEPLFPYYNEMKE